MIASDMLVGANQRKFSAEKQAFAITMAMHQARDVETLHALAMLHHDAELDMLRAEQAQLRIKLATKKKRRQ